MDYRMKMIAFFKAGMPHLENDEEIEGFYGFIDELEEAALKDCGIYELIADCHIRLGNPPKAKEAFLKCYDEKNKKHRKKLYEYDNMCFNPISRPRKRPTELPPFICF